MLEIASHTAATKLCSSGSQKETILLCPFFLTLLVFPLFFRSFISSFPPSEILCSFSTLMFHMNRMEFLSSSGGSSNLRVNTANWSKGTTFYFTANIPELNFILPCMTRLHVPQDQREDVFILQDFTRCSWYYFFPVFKPVNSGERISSNGTGYQDILPRSCCH